MAQIWYKREDLLHTGAHKINNALGQALMAKWLGKRPGPSFPAKRRGIDSCNILDCWIRKLEGGEKKHSLHISAICHEFYKIRNNFPLFFTYIFAAHILGVHISSRAFNQGTNPPLSNNHPVVG
jgi:hypothetical protein